MFYRVMVLMACTVWIEEIESLQTCAVATDTGRFLVDGIVWGVWSSGC